MKKDRQKASKKAPSVTQPLSVLTESWRHLPVVDIEAYVNRSVEVRHKEIMEGKFPGKIKRPMNAFMLYRKAYQNRTKDWCLQNNHQVVSQVCGESWPLEPEEVRNKFTAWAKIERDNHAKAFPDYKFTPSKPNRPQNKKGAYDSEGSDLEDFEWRGGKKGLRTRTSTQDPDADYQPPRAIYHRPYPPTQTAMQGMGMPPHDRSTFHYNNPGKLMPAPYDPRGLSGHYYQAHQVRDPHRQLAHSPVEDILLRKTPSPGIAYQTPVRGFHLLQYPPPQAPVMEHQYQQQQPRHFERRIDPSLLPQDGPAFDSNFNGMFAAADGLDTNQDFQQFGAGNEAADAPYSGTYAGLEDTLLQDQQMQPLRETDDSWQIEPLESTEQFDNWLEQPSQT
jgi:hypothetical protein